MDAAKEASPVQELHLQPGDILRYNFRPTNNNTKNRETSWSNISSSDNDDQAEASTASALRRKQSKKEKAQYTGLGKNSDFLSADGTLKIIQWNIERGYKLDGILRDLKNIDADILIVQELDINCKRSGFVNVPEMIAKTLCMECVFVVEFHELDDPLTRVAAEHAAGSPWSYHGNAIFSRFPIADGTLPCPITDDLWFGERSMAMAHVVCEAPTAWAHSVGKDWEREGGRLGEPRRGQRVVLACNIIIPLSSVDEEGGKKPTQKTALQGKKGTEESNNVEVIPHAPPLHERFTFIRCYTLHTEVFGGALNRVRQYNDAVVDAKCYYNSLCAAAFGGSQWNGFQIPRHHPAAPPCHIVIAGDLNTMAHGIVRFSPKYANDRMRWLLSPLMSEGEWFHRLCLSNTSADGPMYDVSSGSSCVFVRAVGDTLRRVVTEGILKGLDWTCSPHWLGLQGHELGPGGLLHNSLFFYDPFHVTRDITLNHPSYFGFVQGKLDWLLLSGLTTQQCRIGNLDFGLSDHKYLAAVVRPARPAGDSLGLQEIGLTDVDGYDSDDNNHGKQVQSRSFDTDSKEENCVVTRCYSREKNAIVHPRRHHEHLRKGSRATKACVPQWYQPWKPSLWRDVAFWWWRMCSVITTLFVLYWAARFISSTCSTLILFFVHFPGNS